MAVVDSYATTMALAGIKDCSREELAELSAFEASAKNNFPNVTFPNKTTHC